ncbi:DUF1742-domain-containing protein [Viridothelium virens]|uniref:DUF1742-domain-containing protein n=1 Tax=Viridothelium virens TaxID=1048519 RepID=A0A6A6GVK6_VIRVR|nr:DUF1742-domain-containing protein [Viridothelium virens]
MSLPNVWHHRRVADSGAKACYVCYKPSTTVLITPDNKDHFYVCVGHLKDRGFCLPIVDEAEAAAQKKHQELEEEIEKVKKEYEEKQKRKAEKRKEKKKEGKGKDSKEKKEEGKSEDAEDAEDEKEKEDKIKELSKSEPKVEDAPRIFALQKNFHQMRLDRIRNAELARRNRERLNNPSLFPTVPSGDP